MIYLLHFAQRYEHAGHYIGYSRDVMMRLDRHWLGNGSKLLRAVQDAGIGWELVRLWEGDRTQERRLHRHGGATRLCPVCTPVGFRNPRFIREVVLQDA